MINELKINLACGDAKKEGFAGIDIVKTSCADYVVDLEVFPWPIESDSVEEIYCSNYIEHIKHNNVALDLKSIMDKSNTFEEFKANINNQNFLQPQDGFIKFINEIYRILKLDGKAKLIAPYYTSERAYGDPTHVRSIADSTCWYLNKNWMHENHLDHYGINCNFDVTISYCITNEMVLKSEEVRNKHFLHDWNAVTDIIIDLVKKN